MKIRIQRRLEFLRNELDRLDSTGQPTHAIQQEIARLQAQLDDLEGRRIVPPSEGKGRFAAMRAHVNKTESAPALANSLLEDDDLFDEEDLDIGNLLDTYNKSDARVTDAFPGVAAGLLERGFTLEHSGFSHMCLFSRSFEGELRLYASLALVLDGDNDHVAFIVKSLDYNELGERAWNYADRYSRTVVVPYVNVLPFVDALLAAAEKHNVENEDKLRGDLLGDFDLDLRRSALGLEGRVLR